MKFGIAKERRPGELRVAVSPETVKKLVDLGAEVAVETGAGEGASFIDAAFEAAGASIASDAASALGPADVVLKVQRPLRAGEAEVDEIALMKRGVLLVSHLAPLQDRAGIQALAEAGVTAFAMELMPRISRAQSMDVLSSQANLAGYKAVLDAAQYYGRAMPMLMTAAGTLAPARVIVLGAGVAGLQAIATARRLGAIVSATDVRPIAKEQVESLGAKFVMVEDNEAESAETEGGYAREMSEDYRRRQAELLRETLKKQDIAICTALIPGRPAPTLITAEMVREMKPGSVIVDLAVEAGGNCELSRPDEVVEEQGVKILGYRNVPSRLATDSSAFYAKNLLNFITPLVGEGGAALDIDWADEIVAGTLVTRDGAVVHPLLSEGSN